VYRDKSLMPSEAIRLLALGLLAERSMTYGTLAREIRQFAAAMAAPSRELVPPPLELLKVEGLAAAEPEEAQGESAVLTITAQGRQELQRLLAANVRAQAYDLNKLIIALKVRFLSQLPAPARQVEALRLAELFEQELGRLQAVRAGDGGGHLDDWLALESRLAEARAVWFRRLAEDLAAEARGAA